MFKAGKQTHIASDGKVITIHNELRGLSSPSASDEKDELHSTSK
jgi:hypothetical protein